MASLSEVDLALLACARRELDVDTALQRVCHALTKRASSRCALLANGDPQPLVSRCSPEESTVFVAAAAAANGTRHLATRHGGEMEALGPVPEALQWIAVEPITTRDGLAVGALVAGGDLGDREDVLSMLPSGALACGEIGFQLLWQRRLWRQMHQFNNLVAALASHVELISALVPEDPPSELTMAVRLAGEGSGDLLEAARALNGTLFHLPRR